MQKLHLVGFTTDQHGLILSTRRGARSGSYHLPVDDALAEAVEDLLARRTEGKAEAEQDAARPRRVESALPVKEIQARLRQGRSVADVAKLAGVDVEWVDRFAAPVFAEQAQVVRRVQAARLQRARTGRSAMAIGDAIRYHLAERSVAMSPEEFERAWSAWQLADGRWLVRFVFRSRGKDQTLRFDLAEGAVPVAAGDRLSSQLGYVAPPSGPPTGRTPRSEPRDPSRQAAAPSAGRAKADTAARAAEAKRKAAEAKREAAEAKREAAQAQRAEAALRAAERGRPRPPRAT